MQHIRPISKLPRPNTAPNSLRKLNLEEAKMIVLAFASCQFLITKMDELSETTFYKQSLKAAGNRFLTELETFTKQSFWTPIAGNGDINSAAVQSDDLLNAFEVMMRVAIEATELQKGKRELFYTELNMLCKRFELSLFVHSTGEAEYLEKNN